MGKCIIYFFLTLLSSPLSSQMLIDGQTLYGNEWVDYNKTYIKVTLDQAGIYKIKYDDLLSAGMPAGVLGSGIQVTHMGNQLPSIVSSDIAWNNEDFIIFYGEKNKGAMDAFFYENPEEDQLNPKYSLYTDDSSYYISWGHTSDTAIRYTELDNNIAGTNFIKKEFYLHKEELVLSDRAWSPPSIDPEISYSSFKTTEGFADVMTRKHDFILPITNLSKGTTAILHYRIGTNPADHNIQVYFNDILVENEAVSGKKVIDKNHEINLQDLKPNSKLTFEAFRDSDLYNVASVSIIYPRETDAMNQSLLRFRMQKNTANNYYEIENFNQGNTNYVLDVTNHRVITPELTGSTAKFLFESSGPQESIVYLLNETNLLSPKSLEEKKFQNIDDLDVEYLILTSVFLDVDDNGNNYVQEYADFRSSQLGGSYKTHVLHVEDLYDLFGYGVTGHSYAMKNFSNYIKTKWPDFNTVLLLGKGLDYTNRNKQTLINSYIPTYGRPGSDNLMFSQDTLPYPFVSIGRVAANNPRQIRDYLDKVKVHSRISDVENLNIEDRLWLKNVIHLSGGGGVNEQEVLFNHLGRMKDTIVTNSYGASATTYRKTSSDPVVTSLSQQILEDIYAGVSMLTFFGHSSQGTFDFSIEDADKYDNYGRWPVMLAMGCKAGDVNANLVSLSEQMVLTKDLGAIAFFASSGNAYPPMLAEMGLEYYSLLGGEYYGKPIGETMRLVLKNQYRPNNLAYLTLHEQNILHGDPAITLFSAPAPDYVVDFSTIVTNDDIGTQDENIEISFDVVNLGKGGKQDSMSNFIIHSYGTDRNDTLYFNTITPNNRTTVNLTLANPGLDGTGKNTINIVLDYDKKHDEYPNPIAEVNNDLKLAYNNEGYCFFVFDNSAFPIYPTEFAIVHEQGITLKASAGNAFAGEQTYTIEIDTTELFDSNLKMTTDVVSAPGLIEWSPNIQYQNEVVYYWRIIPKDVENTIWNTSSFAYLDDGADGWNQSHFYQWLRDDYQTYEMNPASRNFTFADNTADFKIRNLVFNGSGTELPVFVAQNDPQQYLEFEGDGNIKGGVYIAVIDNETGVPWKNFRAPNSLYGSLYGSNFPYRFFFPYWTRTTEERDLAMTLLEDIVPDGNYIVFYTAQRSDRVFDADAQSEEWEADGAILGRDLFSILEKNGATKVRELSSGSKPYIFVYKKGDPSWTPLEEIADNIDSKIELEFTVVGKWNEGVIESTTIGPAQEWDKLLWDLDEIDFVEDSINLNIIGIDGAGNEVLLFEGVDNFEFDLSSIDAQQYPYLKLNLYSSDETTRTSAQMEYWRVLYAAIPEAVLNTTEKFVFNNDTLQIGQPMMLSTIATNITETDMDSLLVKYTIVDASNNEITEYKKAAPLKGGSSVDIDYEYQTADLNGLHQFRVEINPEEDQREQYDFNNLGIIDFTVLGDKINPLLDVTFDGMHIMDGDIVSPTPNICVTLRDESDQFFIDDISNFDLALQALPDPQSYPVDLSASDVIFTPADSTNEFAKLQFLPDLESGEYILYVQGSDSSGNLSGDQKLAIRFEVIKESSITNVLNYPNPFSTSTQFVFTLTGYDVPDVFTIQIMTLSGKVVKEITKEEMGNIRIGVNRTDYKWNGTDEFGNKLANGVYIYRVLTSHSDDEEIKHLNNQSIDSFFTKGFGKLVIMR